MTESTAQAVPAPEPVGDGTRRRQLAALVTLEVRRTLLRGRSLGLYLLALLPVGILAIRAAWVLLRGDAPASAEVTQAFAFIFNTLILTLVVFFGCALTFANTVRREILERTLHVYFLLPLDRALLLIGKYLGSVVAVGGVLAASAAAAFILAYLPSGGTGLAGFLLDGPGLGHLVTYMLVVVLAVVGYGAIFLTLGVFFKKPALPVMAIFGWEWLNFLLPPLLKRLSVLHHVTALTPVPVPAGPFAVLADAPSPLAAVVGLLLLAAVLLLLSAWKLRRTEILYGED